MQNEFSFNLYNSLAPSGTVLALKKVLPSTDQIPVVLCIGSDLSVGDSLGPLCGTMLSERTSADIFVYGTLKKTVTAKEIKYMNEFLKDTHPKSPIIAVDAAVGSAGDIGLIKVTGSGIKPGAGANKKLGKVGDIGILGIVAEKSIFNYSLLNLTRLNLIWSMADIIAQALSGFTAENRVKIAV